MTFDYYIVIILIRSTIFMLEYRKYVIIMILCRMLILRQSLLFSDGDYLVIDIGRRLAVSLAFIVIVILLFL